MKMTGELLRAERLKKDLKIADVAFALKLSNKVIQNIEDGEVESLPAKTFVRGFVKSYAEFLKLDVSVVLNQFQEEMGSTRPVTKTLSTLTAESVSPEPIKKDAPRPQINENINSAGLSKNHILVFVSVTALVLALALVNQFIQKYSKEKLAVTEVAPPAPPPINSVTASTGQPLADLQVMNQTIPASTDATATSTVNDVAADSAAIKTPSSSTSETTDEIKYTPVTASAGKPVEVLIEAKKDMTLQYAKGSATTFESVAIKENSFQIIRSQVGLHLRSADGSRFVMTVNGVAQPVSKAKPFQITF